MDTKKQYTKPQTCFIQVVTSSFITTSPPEPKYFKVNSTDVEMDAANSLSKDNEVDDNSLW